MVNLVDRSGITSNYSFVTISMKLIRNFRFGLYDKSNHFLRRKTEWIGNLLRSQVLISVKIMIYF